MKRKRRTKGETQRRFHRTFYYMSDPSYPPLPLKYMIKENNNNNWNNNKDGNITPSSISVFKRFSNSKTLYVYIFEACDVVLWR